MLSQTPNAIANPIPKTPNPTKTIHPHPQNPPAAAATQPPHLLPPLLPQTAHPSHTIRLHSAHPLSSPSPNPPSISIASSPTSEPSQSSHLPAVTSRLPAAGAGSGTGAEMRQKACRVLLCVCPVPAPVPAPASCVRAPGVSSWCCAGCTGWTGWCCCALYSLCIVEAARNALVMSSPASMRD